MRGRRRRRRILLLDDLFFIKNCFNFERPAKWISKNVILYTFWKHLSPQIKKSTLFSFCTSKVRALIFYNGGRYRWSTSSCTWPYISQKLGLSKKSLFARGLILHDDSTATKVIVAFFVWVFQVTKHAARSEILYKIWISLKNLFRFCSFFTNCASH